MYVCIKYIYIYESMLFHLRGSLGGDSGATEVLSGGWLYIYIYIHVYVSYMYIHVYTYMPTYIYRVFHLRGSLGGHGCATKVLGGGGWYTYIHVCITYGHTCTCICAKHIYLRGSLGGHGSATEILSGGCELRRVGGRGNLPVQYNKIGGTGRIQRGL